MTTETILTDERLIELAANELQEHFDRLPNSIIFLFARAIEQAVLQSEQVQAWKRDAERMEWYFGSADKTSWVPEYMRGCNDGWSVDQWRTSIDAAMEKQK